MVNAIPLQKRATEFGKCPPVSDTPIQPEQISVSISPDPVVPGQTVTFNVTGTLSKEITDEYKLVIGLTDLSGTTYAAFIEDVPSTKPNTPFNVVKTKSIPKNLPQSYAIGVGISTLNKPPDVIGCALAVVGGSSSNTASYPIA
ncbi:hypothetical protein C1646_758423 [Rhizophagus diaphanus]|nr:hypothetical protein C1646_758423 [Rhizophagus diaphanus] [Rhizophagus sp. MUCL 43196]